MRPNCRHFDQAIQGGAAFKEVKTHEDAVLFLWKLHNKVMGVVQY